MSDTTRPSPGLLSMPNEILTEICSHAHDGEDTESRGKEWLRAVRLTCKQLHIPATVEFGKRFLGSVPVMAARVSLETLCDICQHPLIKPQVSSIQLFSRRPYENHVKSLGRDLWVYTSNGDLAGLQKNRRLLESYLNLIEDGLALEEYLGPFNYLRCALTMIRTFGKPVTLSVSTHGYVRPLEYLTALGSLLDDSEDTLVDFVDQNCVRPSLGVLLVAAAESGCLVDKIELEIDDSEHEYDVSCWSWKTAFREEVLSKVKIFHVNMTPHTFAEQLHEMMELVLQRMTSLIELRLRTNFICQLDIQLSDINSTDKTFQSVQTRCLQTLELREGACRQKELISLLDRNRDTLKNLRISEYALLGSWEDVLMWIGDQCSLDHLIIFCLIEFDKDTSHDDLKHRDVPLWYDEGFCGGLKDLDEFLEQRRREQAELEEEN